MYLITDDHGTHRRALTNQPEALRLAECLDEPDYCTRLQMRQAAAELRRMHEVNAELLAALEVMVKAFKTYAPENEGSEYNCVIAARAAIAKANGGAA